MPSTKMVKQQRHGEYSKVSQINLKIRESLQTLKQNLQVALKFDKTMESGKIQNIGNSTVDISVVLISII